MNKLYDVVARGYAANAGGYAAGRPDYPVALDRWLREQAGLGVGKVVIDLGAGTGKFVSRVLATGATVIAVEPVAEMRERLVADFAGIDARIGMADAMPIDDASVDAVVCAQSFHWFSTKAAMAEIARVLKPGGVLALIWNVRDESTAWVKRLTGIITPYEGDAPRHYKGEWRRVFPAAGFGPLEESAFPHEHVGPPERVIVERFMSVSFIASQPAATRAYIEAQLRDLIASEPTLAGHESVVFPYRTVAFRCVRTA